MGMNYFQIYLHVYIKLHMWGSFLYTIVHTIVAFLSLVQFPVWKAEISRQTPGLFMNNVRSHAFCLSPTAAAFNPLLFPPFSVGALSLEKYDCFRPPNPLLWIIPLLFLQILFNLCGLSKSCTCPVELASTVFVFLVMKAVLQLDTCLFELHWETLTVDASAPRRLKTSCHEEIVVISSEVFKKKIWITDFGIITQIQ